MRVTFDDMAERFHGILSGELLREDAACWAAAVMQADDARTVEVLPHQDRGTMGIQRQGYQANVDGGVGRICRVEAF
ncbi:hypothetical protein C7I55_11965 [Sphingomonas deserti]|uniref:Uncharacterized protein n=1 Tax=Allosphingosinicella deserti TaxID=2116704 RepID=A0A2P7QSL0_9SPHN|nr:hypothetical protein C7I55_11965 [Sphingomonas deserti]